MVHLFKTKIIELSAVIVNKKMRVRENWQVKGLKWKFNFEKILSNFYPVSKET